MEEELKGWDKVGATIRKRAALSAYASGRQKLSPKLLNRLREDTAGDLPRPKRDWIAERPVVKDLI